LLIENEKAMRVSEIEADLAEPGKTLLLISTLYRQNPYNRYRLIAGADIYFERCKWYRFDLIEKMAPPVYVARKGISSPDMEVLDAPIEVSSSQIRKIFEKRDLSNKLNRDGLKKLMPANIIKYIENNNLYKGA
jgi:nicotinate-nucleotide adenylyltransferase